MKSINDFLNESVQDGDVNKIIASNLKDIESFHRDTIKKKYAILNIDLPNGDRVQLCGTQAMDINPRKNVYELYDRNDTKLILYSGKTLSVKNITDVLVKLIKTKIG